MKFKVGDIVIVDLNYDPNMDYNSECLLEPYTAKIDRISKDSRTLGVVPECDWGYLTYCVCGEKHRGWFDYPELELHPWNDFQDKIKDRLE